MIYRTIQRKLKITQHEPNWTMEVISDVSEGIAQHEHHFNIRKYPFNHAEQ